MNCLYEELSLMQITGTDEVWSAAGKVADFRNKGFLVTHTTSYVWDPKSEATKVDCEFDSKYDGSGMLVKLGNNTARIRDIMAQTDFLIDQQNTTV